jgi:hypothetical protein
MFDPQVPMSIFILSFRSRWHSLVDVTGEQLTEEAGHERPVGSTPAKEGYGGRIKVPVSITILVNTKGRRIAGCGRVVAQVVRKGLSMVRLTVKNHTMLFCSGARSFVTPRL